MAATCPAWMALPLPAVVFDAQGRFAALNDAAQSWFSLSQKSVAGLATDDQRLASRLRVDPTLPDLLTAVAAGDETLLRPALRWQIGDRAGRFDTRIAALHLAPSEGGVSAVIVPAAVAGIARKTAHAAIGMADMLAHEIKNPLSGIRGAAQLLAEGLGPEDRELAELIVAESRRIVALLDQVERFGDTTSPKLVPMNIHDVLDRARRTFQLTGATARLITDYDPSLPAVLADADLIVQAVLNLLRNAAEALARDGRRPEDTRGPGTIRLRTFYDGTVRRPEDNAPLPLQVDIEDDGPGIPDAIAEQVFEPFVSTRQNGTGLGLALVSKIVGDLGAGLHMDSRPGRTVVRISLPFAGKETPWTAPS